MEGDTGARVLFNDADTAVGHISGSLAQHHLAEVVETTVPARETVDAISALKKHEVLLGELAARLALDISLRLKLLKTERIYGKSEPHRTDSILEDPRHSAFAHGIGSRLGAGAAFAVIVMLSLGLGWSIWAALRSLAVVVLKPAG